MRRKVNDKTINYNLRFIESDKFMMSSLDEHVNNLSELFDCKCGDKNKQQIEIKQNDQIVYTRCKICHSKQTIESLKDKFPSTFQLTNSNIDKFIFLLKKGVYPYEYVNSWKKIDEIEFPSIDKCYSNLNLKIISKDDHKHALKVWSTFNIKNLGEYHDLYVQSDTT